MKNNHKIFLFAGLLALAIAIPQPAMAEKTQEEADIFDSCDNNELSNIVTHPAQLTSVTQSEEYFTVQYSTYDEIISVAAEINISTNAPMKIKTFYTADIKRMPESKALKEQAGKELNEVLPYVLTEHMLNTQLLRGYTNFSDCVNKKEPGSYIPAPNPQLESCAAKIVKTYNTMNYEYKETISDEGKKYQSKNFSARILDQDNKTVKDGIQISVYDNITRISSTQDSGGYYYYANSDVDFFNNNINEITSFGSMSDIDKDFDIVPNAYLAIEAENNARTANMYIDLRNCLRDGNK